MRGKKKKNCERLHNKDLDRSGLRGLEEKKPRGGESSKAGAQARVPGLKGATMGALA